MRKPFFSFDRDLTSEHLFEKLPKQEQTLLNDFETHIKASAGELRAKAHIVEIIRLREITGKSLFSLDDKDLDYFVSVLRNSGFSDHTKNKIKGFVSRFLKWSYKNWSEVFNELKVLKLNSSPERKKKITEKELISEEQIMKLLEAEPTLYWKTFLIVQAESAMRTTEARKLCWSQIDFQDDGFTTLNIPSKKNRDGSIKVKPIIVKKATKFLQELKKQQDQFGIKTDFVFPSPRDPNKEISKAVNLWFNQLCKKVLGRPSYNYILRHSKGTHLQEKVRKGELSKDNAVQFMRHSERVFDRTYSHMDEKAIIALMKKQIYNTKELTAEEKGRVKELEEEIENQKKEVAIQKIRESLLFQKLMNKISDKEFKEEWEALEQTEIIMNTPKK